jgi:beta-glucanase (GH16 family)
MRPFALPKTPSLLFGLVSVVAFACSSSTGSTDAATSAGGGSGLGGSVSGGAPGAGGATGRGGSPGSGGAGGGAGNSGLGGISGAGGVPRSGGNTGRDAGLTGSGGVTATGGIGHDGGPLGSGGGARGRDLGVDMPMTDDAGSGGVAGRDGSTATEGATSVCPAGYQLTWSDEFDGASGAAVDSAKWVFESGAGGWGNSELEYYRTGAANAALDGNGNLVITAKQETYSGSSYTSARMKTQGLASWKYGHIEARIKLPYGQGIWPAFWMLGEDISTNSWPKCGEIDIMENIGKEPSVNHGSLHMPAAGTSNDSELTGSYTLKSGKLSDDFHTYAIDWSASSIAFYFDGALYETQTPAAATGRTWEFDKPFFILLNVAVGGQWPGSPDSTTVFPQTMTIDYVRVCQQP